MSAFMPEKDGRRVPFSELNIAPMISVLLAVMTVFMLAAPASNDLATRSGAGATCFGAGPLNQPIELSIKRTGEIYWDGTSISHASLSANFAMLARRIPSPSVVMNTERTARYELLAQVLETAHEVDFKNINIGRMTEY